MPTFEDHDRPPARDRLACAFLAGIVALAVAGRLLDLSPASLLLIPCPIRSLTDVPCPGCGMTRALLSIARGDLSTAWRFHPFAFLLVAGAGAIVLSPRLVARFRDRTPPKARIALVACLLLAVLGRWIAMLVHS
ncbi:MAG TPA: DUF2752 domain-containing protein [Planctomycetota bacterium]|nr:DUF2752 domain-containing protein [Planctomycetota bacterium]